MDGRMWWTLQQLGLWLILWGAINYLDPWIGSANLLVPLYSVGPVKRRSEADLDDVPALLITLPPA